MPQIVFSSSYAKQKHEKAVSALAFEFVQKLALDDTVPGLHIEPIQRSADPRVRTGRLNQKYRAVLYRIDDETLGSTYVFAGVWNHDEAIEYARTHELRVNPVNGVAELIKAGGLDTPAAAIRKAEYVPSGPATVTHPTSVLKELSYLPSDLVDAFGFSPETADFAFGLATVDEVKRFASTLSTGWHTDVLDGMLAEMSISEIQESLDLVPVVDDGEDFRQDETRRQPVDLAPTTAGTRSPEPSDIHPVLEPTTTSDHELLAALKHPAAQSQWRFVEDEAEMRDLIESGDLAGWRVYLHPEQRRYVERDYNGAFRLTGGAGTGKTVVLLHRARRLVRQNPQARVILTTFTRQLAANLQKDLERLDPKLPIAAGLGEPGLLIRGIDQLAAAVRKQAGTAISNLAAQTVGIPLSANVQLVGDSSGWKDTVDGATESLPEALESVSFLQTEYLQVVLPNRITERDDYRSVRRPGRGVALDRGKRDMYWELLSRRRDRLSLDRQFPFAELAETAAAYLESSDPLPADHVLVDEAQDLNPSHWKLLRALVTEGPNDLFIAEDSHQRIYGQRVVLSRFGIAIRGRSRRLSLNYRTTAENLRYALGVLEGGDYLDIDGEHEGVVGPYRSARTGPEPSVLSGKNTHEQIALVSRTIRAWLDANVPPASIAVLCATRATRLQEKLAAAGIPAAEPKGDVLPEGKVSVLTMHKAKGLEFSRVVIFDISEGTYPLPVTMRVLPEELPEAISRAKSLLYVASSRARDELVISCQGSLSELALSI